MVSLEVEATLWEAGARVVAGIDEVGRGALAGPVSVGVCAVARCDTWPGGLADSKQLSARARQALLPALEEFGLAHAVGHASAAEIDAHGIVAALRLAGMRALGTLEAAGVVADAVLLDGSHDWLSAPPADLFADAGEAGDTSERAADAGEAGGGVALARTCPPVTMVVKGDARCASIAAASVLAKVERDALMVAAHGDHPAYGWDSNKGYGAAAHLEALATHGPSPLHRVSWKLPVRVPGPAQPRTSVMMDT